MDGEAPVPVESAPSAPHSLAQLSLMFGMAGFPFGCAFNGEPATISLCGILAIVSGHLARRHIRKSHGHLTGSGMAMVGLVLGYFWLLMAVMSIHGDSHAINMARKIKTLATATALEKSITNFQTEYGKPPDVPTHLTTDTADGIKLLNILLGLDEHSDKEQNSRKIRFLEVREGKKKKGGLIYNSSGTGIDGLYDPWGNPYTVELAKPGEENLHFTIGSKPLDLPGRRIAVYSPGMDRVLGTADDIRTW